MRHIYVHVPFCRRRCTYCDFAIAVRKAVPASDFLAALRAEHRLRREAGEWDDEPVATLYLGGGTPSLLPPDAVALLVSEFLAEGKAIGEGGTEVTLEANPEDVTPEACRAWVQAGVNRVSLGAQSFDPRVLAWMHRSHPPDAAARALRGLRQAGIGAVSLDLIFGLPEELGADFASSLEAAIALEPDHLSVYGLTAEPRTPYARLLDRNATRAAPDDRYADEFLAAHRRLASAGYEHYEVSNYARPGRWSHHNQVYWSGAPYAGLGPSAHRFRPGQRSWNVPAWTAYQRLLGAGNDPTGGRESLTAEEERLERVYLSLRTSGGLGVSGGIRRDTLRQAVAAGWLEEGDGRVFATPAGWLRLDELVAALTTSAEGG
ncbi:MAG TPA: radical SAM family heme chaperone HemW [Gemmatimonadales bacterium]